MLSSPAITRLKIAGAPFAFFLLAVHSPFSYGAPKEVNINNEHIFLNTPQDEETVFNITNGGSLTVSSTTAGFLPPRSLIL
ncbi:hypothetical protein [Erwinia sp. CGal63]|uniref:hypothetical protein n=1 Tax=Erwinia sp. CGal63 TaxID=2919889 RepID=UPI003009A737